MASMFKVFRSLFHRHDANPLRYFHKRAPVSSYTINSIQIMGAIGGTIAIYTAYKSSSSHSVKAYKLKPEPLYKNHQLLGDSQFVRFAEQLLSYSHYTTYADNRVLRRIGYCVSGQKIKDLKNRLEAREFPIHPNVITLIGTNDIFCETRMSEMCKNYDRMLDILKEKCDKIVLLTVPPVARNENENSHWQTLKFFNDYVHQYADDHQVFVVDLCSLFISYDNSVSKEYYESVFNTGPKVDLLHLNKKGFKMLQSILQVQYFDKIGAATD